MKNAPAGKAVSADIVSLLCKQAMGTAVTGTAGEEMLAMAGTAGDGWQLWSLSGQEVCWRSAAGAKWQLDSAKYAAEQPAVKEVLVSRWSLQPRGSPLREQCHEHFYVDAVGD